ncbi:MAG TPA: AI-2E family transporter [Acidimicrobiales bacterium]|nr:AI-2E family transporter [Acidimicrobiales bacterium]
MIDGPTDVPGGVPASAPPARQRLLLDIDGRTIVALLLAGLLAFGILAFIRLTPSMLTKVVVGVVIALALDPVVNRVRARIGGPSSRGFAVAIVGTGLGLVFSGVLLVLGPAAIEEASSLRDDLPATIEESYSWPIVGGRIERADVAERVDDAIERLPGELDDEDITRFAEDLLGGLLTTVVVLLTAVAVMLDGEANVQRVRNLFEGERRERLDAVGRIVYRTFGNYFAGSLFVAILNGLVVLTVALALGIPLAPLAGLWSMLTNLIPQIGGFLGGSFLVLLALTEGPLVAAIALVVFMVYQNLENNVIQPAVVGSAVDLTPPTTMLAALIGGAVAGVPGALIATPVVGAVKVLYLSRALHGPLDRPMLEEHRKRRGGLRRVLGRLRPLRGGSRRGGRPPSPPTA